MAKKHGTCRICGEVRPLTRDHIPQAGLYPKTIRALVPNLNTVLACEDCNNASSTVDEILKVFVGLVGDAHWRRELTDSVDSTLRKNLRLTRLLDEHSRFEEIRTKTGGSVPARVIKLPGEQTENLMLALERIVKGLYFQHFGSVLVQTHEVSVFYPQVIDRELRKELDDALMQGDWRSINGNTFHYCFVHINHGDTVCVINIYENIEFCYCIRPKDWRSTVKTGPVAAPSP
jgi:hypothetical protein